MCFKIPIALQYSSNSRQHYVSTEIKQVLKKMIIHDQWFSISRSVSGEKIYVQSRMKLFLLMLQKFPKHVSLVFNNVIEISDFHCAFYLR